MTCDTRVRLVITGVVQGVSFRWYARLEAERLRLSGWVRNLPTGEVEAVAEGPAADVDAFVTWCRHGPPSARVDRVDATREEPRGEGPFSVVRGP
jgi:acylphosphatase